jgi:hypothetical protein
MGYVNQLNKTPAEMEQAYESIQWYIDQAEMRGEEAIYLSDSSTSPVLK